MLVVGYGASEADAPFAHEIVERGKRCRGRIDSHNYIAVACACKASYLFNFAYAVFVGIKVGFRKIYKYKASVGYLRRKIFA